MGIERDLFKLLTLGITAVVIGNVIVHARDVGTLISSGGSAYTGILKQLTR